VGIDDLDGVDIGDLALADRLRLRLHPLEVEPGGLGVEVGAVVKLHPAAELEDERLGIRLRPRLGEARLDPELGVERHQRLVDVVVGLPVDLAARQVRVHRGRLDVEAHAQRAALLRGQAAAAAPGPRPSHGTPAATADTFRNSRRDTVMGFSPLG